MSETIIEIWTSKPPDNANARHAWRKATSLKKHFWRELDARRCMGYHFPPPPAQPLKRARLEITWFHSANRFLDTDNAIRRCKPVCDFLVSHGYLAGDDPAHLVWTIPEQIHDKPRTAPPMCTVRLRLIELAAEVAA